MPSSALLVCTGQAASPRPTPLWSFDVQLSSHRERQCGAGCIDHLTVRPAAAGPRAVCGATSMMSIKLPLWLRIFLVIAVLILAAAGGLFGYRYYTHPVTLTVAVGSIDGEASKAMSAIASQLVSTNAPVRFNVIDTGTVLAAAQAFAAGKVNLAVVRGDVGDLSQGGSVVIVAHVVALIIAPPSSSIDSMDALKGHTVGVIGADTNSKLVDVLSKEIGRAH